MPGITFSEKKHFYLLTLLIITFNHSIIAQDSRNVYFAMGLKIGEVTDSSAIIWTRLCGQQRPVPVYHQRRLETFRTPLDFDENMPVDSMEGALPGTFGEIQIEIITPDSTIIYPWKTVSVYKDYTLKEKLSGLNPNTNYQLVLKGRKNSESQVRILNGKFKTPPSPNDSRSILFTSSTCQYYWSYDDSVRGFKIYDQMRDLNPDFHIQSGDFVYYDKPGPMATTVELARHKWHAMSSWPALVDFYRQTPVYQQKDDHDLLKDDCTPFSAPFGELTFEDGLAIWYEQVPVEGLPYRSFRWGDDLQIWLAEGREFRSEKTQTDQPGKSIWGEKQKEWFARTARNSDATFKILFSATPVVGPDRDKGKYDNHSNLAFQSEGDWLRRILAEEGFFVVNGDRHWQYVSQDPENMLFEFSQGPSSDSHAQGWKADDIRPQHKFLRVKGGFLSTEIISGEDSVKIRFQHFDVDGNSVHTEEFDRLRK